MPARAIEGLIVFGEDARPFRDASIEVVLEDTTYADEPAVAVARVVLAGVSFDGEPGGGIAFTLPRPPAAQGRRRTLRVLVDVDRDGRLGKNDYRNAESVSVPPGPTGSLTVRVKRVD